MPRLVVPGQGGRSKVSLNRALSIKVGLCPLAVGATGNELGPDDGLLFRRDVAI